MSQCEERKITVRSIALTALMLAAFLLACFCCFVGLLFATDGNGPMAVNFTILGSAIWMELGWMIGRKGR